MSKYIGEFTSINGLDYKIEVTSKKGNVTENVILSETPFVVTSSENDSIYEPVKTTGATITFLTNKLPTDIYSGSTLGTSVKVTSDGNIIWTGYLTPCAYTQGFDKPLEELQLECVDGLSVLQEIPYTSTKDISPFMDIIFNCLKKAQCFKYLYVNDTVQFSASGTENIMSKIRVQEQNFFDEKDYDAQPDDEVAWSCFKVFSEIMRYMGYTITAKGEDVYIIDYDSIGKGRTRYFKYDISGTSLGSSTVVTLSHTHKIVGSSYAETGNSINLSKIFNKLVITDEFYQMESALPGINEVKNLENITANYDGDLINWMNNDWRFLESGIFTVDAENFFATLTKNENGDIFFVVGKFFKNSMITTYHYAHDIDVLKFPESQFKPMCYSKLWKGKGAIYVGYFVSPVPTDKYNTWHNEVAKNWTSEDQKTKLNQYAQLTSIANIPNVKLSYYILCLNQDSFHITHDKVKNYPFFTITKNISTVFGGVDGYLMIKGDILRHPQFNAPFPNVKQNIHKDTKKTSIYINEGYFWARLKWGNLYWKQEDDYNQQGVWSSSPAYFKIFYGDPTTETRVESWCDKFLTLYNTCKVWGIDDTGYYIPTPSGYNLEGTVELTVYANKDSKGHYARDNKKDKKNSYEGYPPKVVIFQNLDITVGYADGTLLEDSADEDTCYCNEVTSYVNINEADGINFKICTFDNKTPSYSTVDYLDSANKSQYLDKTYNLATGMSLRPEEQYIFKYINQYEEPRVEYKCNLKADIGFMPYSLLEYNQMTGKKFIIDSYTTDYRYNKTELKIVEKNKTYS